MKAALIFPGQGSQFVGMGKDFFDRFGEVRADFAQSSEVLGIDMEKLCFEGPEDFLKQTENTQPALLTVEYAITRRLLRYFDHFGAAAGHSLGEYSALLAAGVFSFGDALKIVRRRGEYMSSVKNGSLVACLGMSNEDVWGLCRELSSHGVISPALFNAPGQIVVAGEVPVLEKFIEKTSSMEGVKSTMLKVSGPFHCALLSDAGKKLGEYIAEFDMKRPHMNVPANATGEVAMTTDEILENLVKQVSCPVYWTRCIENLILAGYTLFVEVGPGNVLKGLMRKIDRNVRVLNLSKAEDFDKVVEELENTFNSTEMERE